MNRGGTYEAGHTTVQRNDDRTARQADAQRRDRRATMKDRRSI